MPPPYTSYERSRADEPDIFLGIANDDKNDPAPGRIGKAVGTFIGARADTPDVAGRLFVSAYRAGASHIYTNLG